MGNQNRNQNCGEIESFVQGTLENPSYKNYNKKGFIYFYFFLKA
jgi:hypothetical protein